MIQANELTSCLPHRHEHWGHCPVFRMDCCDLERFAELIRDLYFQERELRHEVKRKHEQGSIALAFNSISPQKFDEGDSGLTRR